METPISLQNAYDALQNQLKDISDVPVSTFVQWCQYINEFVYRFLIGTDPDRYILEKSFQITAGEDTYALDSDFRDMSTWNTGFFIMSPNPPLGTGYTTLSTRLPLSGPGNQTPGYYIARGNFIFTPMPVQNTVLTERYIPKITVLTAITDYFTMDSTSTGVVIIPYEYLQYIVYALVQQYQVWDEQPGAESYADARFVRCLDELCDTVRRQPSAIGMPDFSQIY
jgi:hypothetical protein